MHFILPLRIYPFDVLISVGQTDRELKSVLNEYGEKRNDYQFLMNLDETVLARTAILPSNRTIIRFNNDIPQSKLVGLIAHEVFHAVVYIMSRIGMKLKPCSDEAYAYLIDYMTQEIYNRIK